MPQPLTIATLSVLAVAGSVTGVYLGQSAIAEINPAYYDEPETRFHADMVPNRPSFDAPVTRAGYLTQAEAQRALGSGCVGCLTYPEEYYPVHDSSVDKYQPGYAEMDETPSVRHAVYAPDLQDEESTSHSPDAREEQRAADFATIERYAGYTLEEHDLAGQAPAARLELASVPDEALSE